MKYQVSLLVVFLQLLAAPLCCAHANGSFFAVIVSDAELAAEWYENVLGLERVSTTSRADRFTIINLRRNGLFVELLEVKDSIERPIGRVKGPFKVGFLVSDLVEFVERLPNVVTEPELIVDSRNSLRLVQLSDPDGNTVQVMEMQTDQE